MNPENDKRSSIRYPRKSGIIFSIFNRGNCMAAESVDVCEDGLKFRSGCALKPGTAVCIRAIHGRDRYRSCDVPICLRSVALARVKWCREVVDLEKPIYEVGVKYYPPDY